MPDVHQNPDASDKSALSVALIGPDEQRRKAVATALSGHHGMMLREFSSFPTGLEELPQTLEQHYDVVIVDVDSDPDYAFDLVETVCASGRAYVMAYSAQADMKLAIRFMRAGVREFFTLPLDPAEIAGALTRASIHNLEPRQTAKIVSKLFVFLGAKGGCGVTTLAANFALALAQESDRNTLLIDLGLPLGDVAINLGMVAGYSVATALQDPSRLDAKFLSSLVAKHSSGLSVLAAPGEFPEQQPTPDAIEKLLAVTRQSYDYVVVDAGSRVDLIGSALFEESSTVYLITQVGISELRNANRMVSQFFATRGRSLQIVLNRYKTSDLLFDDKQISKALTRPAQWKIPDDYAAARRTRDTATPLALMDSSLSQAIRQMARAACGLPADKNGKKGFLQSLQLGKKGFLRALH
jgi:pilus assembly protein CpaE